MEEVRWESIRQFSQTSYIQFGIMGIILGAEIEGYVFFSSFRIRIPPIDGLGDRRINEY